MNFTLLMMASAAVLTCVAAWAGPTNDTALPPQPPENRPLEARFAEPAASSRILRILHSQADDPAAQDRQLRQLAAQGFGGFAGNVSFTGYVDDESKWPPFLRGVRMAKASGMSLWLYDECGYPSGSARDLTLAGHPEWAARGLLVAVTNTSGGEIALDLPPGALVSAVAVPVRDGVAQLDGARDLAATISDRRLRWTAPAGDWTVLAMTDDLIYEGTHAAVSLAFKKPCINLLMPETTARFLEVTHDRYAARLGPDLGKWFVSTFTDEPSLMNLWMRPMPYRVLPWSANLPGEFRKRRGADLAPLLPALVVEAGPRGAKARYDFWDTIADLVSENYFGQIQTWCRAHGFASGGHLLMEESLAGHVPLYGCFFRCARRLDAPSMDCLTSLPPEVPWYVARMIDSIAGLEGRTVTMSEASDHSQRYRGEGDKRPVRIVTADEIRGSLNRQLWGGIGVFTSYYRFQDLSDDQLRELNRWVGRCSTLLAGGNQVADIAVLHPVESLWPRFVPALRGATDVPDIRRIETVLRGVRAALYTANRDFAFVDARALTEAKVEGDTLVHGKLRWRVVVLPGADTLPMAAWENLAAFQRGGGAVISVGARPANSEAALPDPRVQSLAAAMFGGGGGPSVSGNAAGGAGVVLPDGLVSLLPRMLDALIERDAAADGPGSPVRTTHRRVADHDVYFAINDGAAPWEGTLRFPGRGAAEMWDPATGAKSALTNGAAVPLKLGAYGGMLFRSPSIDAPRRLRGAAGTVPALARSALPAATPSLGAGRGTRTAMTGDPAAGWCATSTATTNLPDTHLFVSFDHPKGLDLGAAEGLVVESTVAAGAKGGPELLAIIRTTDGVDYITGTGRLLGTPGTATSHVAFADFDRTGWSKPGPDRLDPSRIASIRLGWGGHPGVTGETIEFTVRAPDAFSFGPANPAARITAPAP